MPVDYMPIADFRFDEKMSLYDARFILIYRCAMLRYKMASAADVYAHFEPALLRFHFSSPKRK